MADPNSINTLPGHERPSHPNTLAEIQFASVIDPDLVPSDDETPEVQSLPPEDAQSVIGVSIGQAQTRLTSPKTPAAEKAAALEDVEGGGFFDENTWEKSGEATPEDEQREPVVHTLDGQMDGVDFKEPRPTTPPSKDPPTRESPVRLPSPWRAGPKRFQRLDDTRASLRESFSGNRRRASSGGSTAEAFRKYLPFNLPSITKSPNLSNFSLPSFTMSSGLDNSSGNEKSSAEIAKIRRPYPAGYVPVIQSDSSAHSRIGDRPKLPVGQQSMPVTSTSQDGPSSPSINGNLDKTRPVSRKSEDDPSQSHHLKLRRSASDNSLLLVRSLSHASSLGDDSRFEHVQEQVNSRLKAIKDSWQDANFKLPSLPTMPNFSFGSSRQDLFQPWNSNSATRTSFGPPSSKRVSLTNPAALTRGIVAPTRKISTPKTDTNVGNAGMSASNAAAHPFFTRAVKDLTGDVVIMGGYRGSILRSAEPPNRQLWVPIKVGLNLRKVDLEVGLDPEDEEKMPETIIPGGMLTHIGPVDISKRLIKRLRASENARNGSLRVHNYGYDWRLSPHLLSRQLTEFLSKLPCNAPNTPRSKRGAIVIAHSLGGLIARHVINQNPSLVSGVIYAGVPQTCVNILGPLRNGDDVLLSSRVLTAQVNFTIRTSFALLPLDGKCFFDRTTKEQYPVDFFDVNTWIDYCLSPCVAPPLPALNSVPSTASLSGLLNSMTSSMTSVLPIIGRKGSISRGSASTNSSTTTSADAVTTSVRETSATKLSDAEHAAEGRAQASGFAPQMGSGSKHAADYNNTNTNNNLSSGSGSTPSTSTLSRARAITYLDRTLRETKRFKQELAFNPSHSASNLYPPIAVIYGKSTPTVYGARVDGREAIRRADAYDELAFASGDGVVLARAAMVPSGYEGLVVRGGVVASERGHVTLLGDLEAVGRCLGAVLGGRGKGVGTGEVGGSGIIGKNKGKGKEARKGEEKGMEDGIEIEEVERKEKMEKVKEEVVREQELV
ncbi:hypothetical protein K432DRAFT_387049 [Lepidopterella palustris CBS 459.81]|uniref:Uncharacterized protein n=1 Tax=Lepidopterella palustris CBS 459.81 TaxID=1314670 RepID=A0A8E2DYI1_9PEZI|nr:hypothetical protein K432DRAFT_387049 [Lepidopterella palustris CBS 459.81]